LSPVRGRRDPLHVHDPEAVLPHDVTLIATIAAGLGLAFVFGFIALRLRLPAIAGYLVAGIMIGPFTPGFVADQELSNQLAEIGVILLMFGVGLHFSLKDLLAVRNIAVPGAIGQIGVATLLGMALSWGMGWPLGAGFVFGLALSVASTVVLLRALQERRLIETERGRIAVGWLIVEDIAMVLALVLLPPLAGMLGGSAPDAPAPGGLASLLGPESVWAILGLTMVKVAVFVALMLVFGRSLVPWILHIVAHLGSRELFRLSVLALALGVAFGSAELFGVSFALGAFFAGMVMAESPLSTQAARETLPLRNAFAVLFFVSVGMLFDPAVLWAHPVAVVGVFLTIVVGKSLAAYLIVRAFGHPRGVAFTISASLAQIGEFSFILAALGVHLAILPTTGRDLVVAGALLSILVNPLLFMLLDKVAPADDHGAAGAEAAIEAPEPVAAPVREERPTSLAGHGILVGHGRVGSIVSASLEQAGATFLVIEENADALGGLSDRGIETYTGAAGERALLEQINLAGAKWLISAIPDAFEAGHLIETARAINPSIRIIARARSPEAVEHLRGLGADVIIVGTDEVARGMIREVLQQPDGGRAGGGPGPSAPSQGSEQYGGGAGI